MINPSSARLCPCMAIYIYPVLKYPASKGGWPSSVDICIIYIYIYTHTYNYLQKALLHQHMLVMGWFFWNGTGAHVSRHATTMIHGIRSPISLWFTSSSSRCNIQGTPAASASVDAFPVQTLMLRKLDLKSEIYRAILELQYTSNSWGLW